MPRILSLLLAAVLCLGSRCGFAQQTPHADFAVIPYPERTMLSMGKGFVLTPSTVVCYDRREAGARRNAEFLVQYIAERTGMALSLTTKRRSDDIILLTQDLVHDNKEAYEIAVNHQRIVLRGASASGAFYAVQTLRKALPGRLSDRIIIPRCTIKDKPRFAYRGAHLDVSRHFFPVDSVKTYLDMCALHAINAFHFHLTDDQGWRFASKKYPRLTEVGSQRAGTVIGHNTGEYDGVPYGGYYTQEQLRDIVAYAAERHITVVPEIDMPGHMLGALAAYPELGCTGGPYAVWQQWGVSDDVLCAGNDKVYQFIDDILDEVCAIFPSPYIHIGGDECPKTRWKACPKCQAMIAREHLASDARYSAEECLQSHLIRHAGAHLKQLGRRMIGWDEILEGGTDEDAIVMSWRGEEGGIEAARLGRDVIMTPNTYLYFDYYMSRDIANEPSCIGGYLPVSYTYQYEPIPEALTAEEAGHIIGVQANVWTEYIAEFSKVQYMTLPRMAALSELQWSNRPKNYDGFCRRAAALTRIYHEQGWNFARHIFDPTLHFLPTDSVGTVKVSASTFDDAPIHYTLDGTMPSEASPRMTAPVVIDSTATLSVVAYRRGIASHQVRQDFVIAPSTGATATLLSPPAARYTYDGARALTDGILGDATAFNSGCWLGFTEADLDCTIDLGQMTTFDGVTFRTFVDTPNWIFDARSITVEASADGQHFVRLYWESAEPCQAEEQAHVVTHSLRMPGHVEARYVRLRAESEKACPPWHTGAGQPGFLFVDEITVE